MTRAKKGPPRDPKMGTNQSTVRATQHGSTEKIDIPTTNITMIAKKNVGRTIRGTGQKTSHMNRDPK